MAQVVVGFDGSSAARSALHWAAEEADRLGHELVVIRSWNDPLVLGPSLTGAWLDPQAGSRQVREDLDDEIQILDEKYPSVRCIAELVSEAPARALVDASQRSPYVIVGSRGWGGFASLLLGSVSQRVAMTAASTVAVVRDTARADGPVVVGVDGSEPSRDALRWAATAARDRHCALRVVMAWSYFAPQGPSGQEPFRADYTEADAWTALGTIVNEVLGETDLEVDFQALCDLPARALLEQAGDASLLVVGPHARNRPAHLGLGSVTLQVLHHAPCPLVIVRSEAEAA